MRWLVAAVCLLASSALVGGDATAASVTFRWDYTDAGAAGFVLYCGSATRAYANFVDVGNTDTYTLAGLTEGRTYYCAVTAYDSTLLESDFSDELALTVPYAAPVVNFTPSATAGTAPLSVSFSNTTTGDVTTWAWAFGDNTGSSSKTPPAKRYDTPGAYTVKLTATGRGGSDSVSKSISVSPPPPVANFTISRTSGAAPLNVAFTNTSAGTVAGWLWDFGDDTSSALQSPPAKVYSTGGSYTVKLKATGPGGENIKTASAPIVVTAAPEVDFSMTPTSGITPLAVTFTNTTTGSATSWAWDFGDGTTSAAKSPIKTYTATGTYTVKLTANWLGGKVTATKSTPVTVKPAPNFTLSATSGTAPLTVVFTNTTTGRADSWVWDFGDGSKTSSAKSPSYTYRTAGSFTVKLTAYGPGGTVVKTAAKPIVVGLPAKPNARFTSSKTGGTTPLTVVFSNLTTGQVDGWMWDFGDGTTSTERSPVKVYSAPKDYIVTLTATGLGGTSTFTAASPIKVTVAQAKFTPSPVRGNAPLAVRFTNTTVGQVTGWAWNFGDGSNSTEKSPLHTYATPGLYTVTLTAAGVGGSSSYSSSIEALAPPKPVAKFSASAVKGYAPLTVRFTNATTGQVNTWAWDFGDGSTSTEKSPPLHTFTLPGVYAVNLTAQGVGGNSSRTVMVNVLRPGLVTGYGFEEAAGALANSVTSSSLNGSIAAASRAPSGKFGRALAFNGVSSWVSVPHTAALALTGGVTLQAWVFPAAAMNDWRSVLTKEQPGGAVYQLYANTLDANNDPSGPAGGVFTSAESLVQFGWLLPASQWSHVATTFDGTTQRLFLNGAEVAILAQRGPLKASVQPLRIGGNNVWGEYFQGLIDELRIYNRALSANEIQADMAIPVVPAAQ